MVAMRSVLIADDSETLRGFYRKLFTDSGWRVLEAKNGQEAVQVADEFSPNVVVLDISMPVMDGIRAARILLNKKPEVHVVLCSLYATDEGINLEAYLEGVDRVLMKSDACRYLVSIAEKLVAGGFEGTPYGDGSFALANGEKNRSDQLSGERVTPTLRLQ